MSTDSDPLPHAGRIGWAIVGLGDYALNQILPSFAACTHSRVAALVSGDQAKARRIARHYGVAESGVYGYNDFDRLRDNPDVDAVYIILPNALHAEYTIRAAQAGKHVLCEKPMAVTVGECEAMIAACRQAGRKLMIGYRVHFEPHNLAARELVRRGTIGDLRLISADHSRPLDPRQPQDRWRTQRAIAGGGVLFDIGIYSLNAARWFTGEEPVAVRATAWSTPGDNRFCDVEESIGFLLQFPGGVIASCNSSYSTVRVKRYRLIGTGGWLDLDPATEYEGNRLQISRDSTVEAPTVVPGKQFARQIDHMSRCILEDRAPITPGEMGLQDVRIMRAIYESAERGVEVSLARSRAVAGPAPAWYTWARSRA